VTFRTGEASYLCEEYALEDTVTPKDRENADDPLDPELDTVENLTELMQLDRENRIVTVATDTAVVTQTADVGADWDTTGGTPKADIFTGISTIQGAILKTPTDIFIPFEVALNLAKHADYTDDYKTSDVLVTTFGLPLMLWGLKTHVVTVGFASADMIGASDPGLTALWSDTVLIALINAALSRKQITFMRTFEREPRQVLRDTIPMQHADVFQVYEEIDEVMVAAAAGYLITNAI